MTRLELRNLCLYWLDDLAGTYFTPTQVNRWLNNAQRECAKQLIQAGENFYVTRVQASTVQNQDTYALPSDFLRLNKIQLVLSGTGVNQIRNMLAFTTLVEIDAVSQSTGTPDAYTLKKACMILRPIPDNVYTLLMDYSYRVSDMTADTSIPDVPPQFHEYLAVLATLDGLFKDQRNPDAMMEKKKYYLDLMKQDSENRQVDSPRMVRETDGTGDSWGFLF